jgi:hypothetical protein
MANDNSVRGSARLLLRLEGLVVLVVSLLLYARGGAGWGTFAALFLLPDLGLLGYLAGPRAGSVAYNALHTYAIPLALAGAALLGAPALLPVALSWSAHIGFDRALGYGLKYGAGFRHTHLGPIGRAR